MVMMSISKDVSIVLCKYPIEELLMVLSIRRTERKVAIHRLLVLLLGTRLTEALSIASRFESPARPRCATFR